MASPKSGITVDMVKMLGRMNLGIRVTRNREAIVRMYFATLLLRLAARLIKTKLVIEKDGKQKPGIWIGPLKNQNE